MKILYDAAEYLRAAMALADEGGFLLISAKISFVLDEVEKQIEKEALKLPSTGGI